MPLDILIVLSRLRVINLTLRVYRLQLPNRIDILDLSENDLFLTRDSVFILLLVKRAKEVLHLWFVIKHRSFVKFI